MIRSVSMIERELAEAEAVCRVGGVERVERVEQRDNEDQHDWVHSELEKVTVKVAGS
jgi:hypothetical protein